MAVALVTGGAIRVGRAIALKLAKEGYDIALHYNGSEAAAKSTQLEIEALGGDSLLIKSDLKLLANPKEIINLASELGELQVLVNSAAIFPENDSIEQPLNDFNQVMDINLKAPLLLAQAFAQSKPSNGHIINILDNRIKNPAGDHLVYRLSKAALWHLTECLAKELAPNIQVNGLGLGAIMAPPGASEDHFMRMANQIPLNRTGSPEAIADAVAFLVAQSFITGAIIPVDGGEFL